MLYVKSSFQNKHMTKKIKNKQNKTKKMWKALQVQKVGMMGEPRGGGDMA